MKYLFESLDDQKRIPLGEVTWDMVKPVIEENPTPYRYQSKTASLPNDFMSSSIISGEHQFNKWYDEFIKRWGAEGELVETRPTHWNLEGNEKWDKAAKIGSAAVSSYYAEKGSGGYTGD